MGGGWLCLCAGNESISFTLVSLPDKRREGTSCVCCLSVSFLLLSLSVSSHMLIAFCRYRSLYHLSHTLPISSFASYLCIITLYLSLSIFGCLPIHSQFLSLAVFYYSVYFHFTIVHSESILISYSLTLSPWTYSGSFSISSRFSHRLSDSVNSKSHLPKQRDVEGKGYHLRLCATGKLLRINFKFNTSRCYN